MNSPHLDLGDLVRVMQHAGENWARWVDAVEPVRSPGPECLVPPPTAPSPVVVDPPTIEVRTPDTLRRKPDKRRTPLTAHQYVPIQADPWVRASEWTDPAPDRKTAGGATAALLYTPLETGPTPTCLLAPASHWWPTLKSQRAKRQHRIDRPAWTRQLALARWPQHPPRLSELGAWSRLVVVVDGSFALTPFLRDFSVLVEHIFRLGLAHQYTVVTVMGTERGFDLPSDAEAVMLLSDLGSASRAPLVAAKDWLAWLAPAVRRRLPIFAWVPSHPSRIPASLLAKIQIIPWYEGSRFKPLQAPQAMHDGTAILTPELSGLWTRLAFALHAEPALLRRLRRLTVGARQPQWEALIWGDPPSNNEDRLIVGAQVAQLHPTSAAHWRQALSQLGDTEQIALWDSIEAQHRHRLRSTLMAERLLLAAHGCPALLRAKQAAIEEATDWFKRYAKEASYSAATSAYLQDLLFRLEGDAKISGRHGPLLAQLGARVDRRLSGVSTLDWLRARQDNSEALKHMTLPWAMAWTNPGSSNKFEPLSGLAQGQTGSGLLSPTSAWTYASWASGAEARTARPAAADSLEMADVSGLHRWQMGALQRQPWQKALGRDKYGVFTELQLGPQTHRFRYIPPGTFLMGSPKGEGDRDEHPQHPVTLTEGFWLAEVPCTQALWRAVMGGNPSRYKNGGDAAHRPVENVSFGEILVFLQRLSALIAPGVVPTLPTEAQWEHACRAGTSTAYWWGDEFDPWMANPRVGATSTNLVHSFSPNPWGLYAMHGNVWERCVDDRRQFNLADVERGVVNPIGRLNNKAHAVRGGSITSKPDGLRSAHRGRALDSNRALQGFRISLRQVTDIIKV